MLGMYSLPVSAISPVDRQEETSLYRAKIDHKCWRANHLLACPLFAEKRN